MRLSNHDFSISDQQQHQLNDYKNIHQQENTLSGLLSAPIQERNDSDSQNNGNGGGGDDSSSSNNQQMHYQHQHHQFQQSDYTQSNDYGLVSSAQTIEDETSYGPFEKLCKLCENPTQANM